MTPGDDQEEMQMSITLHKRKSFSVSRHCAYFHCGQRSTLDMWIAAKERKTQCSHSYIACEMIRNKEALTRWHLHLIRIPDGYTVELTYRKESYLFPFTFTDNSNKKLLTQIRMKTSPHQLRLQTYQMCECVSLSVYMQMCSYLATYTHAGTWRSAGETVKSSRAACHSLLEQNAARTLSICLMHYYCFNIHLPHFVYSILWG